MVIPQTTFTIIGPAVFPGVFVAFGPPPFPPVTLDPEVLLKDRDHLKSLLIQTMIELQLPIPEASEDMVPSAAHCTWERHEKYRKIALAAKRLVDGIDRQVKQGQIRHGCLTELDDLQQIVRKDMPGPISDYTRTGGEE